MHMERGKKYSEDMKLIRAFSQVVNDIPLELGVKLDLAGGKQVSTNRIGQLPLCQTGPPPHKTYEFLLVSALNESTLPYLGENETANLYQMG